MSDSKAKEVDNKEVDNQGDPERVEDIIIKKEEVICPIHLDVVRNPVGLIPCGHHFCKKCITTALKNKPKCPVCKQKIGPGPKFIELRWLKESVDNQEISCTNAKHGCNEKIRLCKIDEHETNCVYKPVMCSNEECDEEIPQIHLDDHLSKCKYHQCETFDYCEFSGNQSEIKKHQKNCQYFKLKGFLKVFEQKIRDMEDRINNKIANLEIELACIDPPNSGSNRSIQQLILRIDDLERKFRNLDSLYASGLDADDYNFSSDEDDENDSDDEALNRAEDTFNEEYEL